MADRGINESLKEWDLNEGITDSLLLELTETRKQIWNSKAATDRQINNLKNQIETLKEEVQLVKKQQKATAAKKKTVFSKIKRRLAKNSYPRQSSSENNNSIVSGISVIMATYQKNGYISEAIESVLNQKTDIPIELLIIVNGCNDEWARELKEQYSNVSCIKVFSITQKGYARALNYGIAQSTLPYITILDDDDFFTPCFLQELASCTKTGSNITCGPISTSGTTTDDYNYTEIAIEKLRANNGKKDAGFVGLFSTTCGKLFSASFLKNAIPFKEHLRNTEDVVFWADNYSSASRQLSYTESSRESYVRRITENSLSRPSDEEAFSFYVTERLEIIGYLEKITFEPIGDTEHTRLIMGLIDAQVDHIKKYYDRSNEEVRNAIRANIDSYPGLLVNKGLFATRSAFAFCHNFSPSIDASAFVATRRLRQINRVEGCNYKWHVVSKNMSDVRKHDDSFDWRYTRYLISDNYRILGATALSPQAQLMYAVSAYHYARKKKVEIIYSRSMFPGSHLAAYYYKRQFPDVTWYAEFSDPVAYSQDPTFPWRDDSYESCEEQSDLLKDFFVTCELLPYHYADHIIFTNSVQMKYMLDYCPDEGIKERVQEKALVWMHPQIEECYTHAVVADYHIDTSKINIAYFGTFYEQRPIEDILPLATRKDVILHLFIPNHEDYVSYGGDQIIINPPWSYLNFLNIASRMDYLFLQDMEPVKGMTPWLPSKLSDYLATKTPIIAVYNEGSPLALHESSQIIKIKNISPDFLGSLRKK